MDGKFCRFSVYFQHHPVLAQIFETHRDWAVGRLHQSCFAKKNGIDLRSSLNCHRRFGGVSGDAFYGKIFGNDFNRFCRGLWY